MKRIFVLLLILINMSSLVSFAGNLTISGVYQGKNLYVQNPFTGNMKDFCTDEVFINEISVLTNIKSSAFEIDLSGLKMNEAVTVRITHKDDCKPKILNPQVIRLNSSFQFISFNIDNESLNWVTKGEKIGDKVYVEQFLYNNWVPLKELQAIGSSTLNTYRHNGNHHSGINKYRIKFIEKEGTVFYSKVIEFRSELPEATFYPKRVANKIYISRTTDFEIIDGYGNIILKGKGKEVPCETLTEGVYYLNIDNKTEKFLKK